MKNLLGKLSGNTKRIAGLDIGSSSVKFVEIEGTSIEDANLVNYAIEPIPRELAAENGKFQDLQAISEIIKKCWKKSGSSIKHVTIALPQSSIISKKATISMAESEADLKYQVESEISKYLPTDSQIDDIAFDFFSFGPNEITPTENDMLLVAAKKEKIEEVMAIIEGAGLIPAILEAEQFSIQNMLRSMVGEDFNTKSYLLADCASNVLRLMVFKNGELVYNKDNNIGGANLTQDIMNNFNITEEEAEKMKFQENNDEIYEMVLKTFLNNYSSEFLRSFQYFTSTSSTPNIDEVYLTGGMAGTKGLEEILYQAILDSDEQNIKSRPQIANPLSKMNKGDKINLSKFAKDESALFLASGLAMRHFLRNY